MKKFMAIAAIFAATMVSFTACDKEQGGEQTDVCATCGQNPCECEAEYVSPITVDGDFADWDALDATKVAVATGSEDSKYTAIKVVKVYADDVYINFYMEIDAAQLTVGGAALDIYLNQDANDGAYDDHWVGMTAVDYLLEDGVFMEAGVMNSFNPGMFQYGGTADAEWQWAWTEVMATDMGIANGKGTGSKYECAIMKDMLMGVELADTFSLGFILTDINEAGDWNAVGVLPNAPCTDENANGIAEFLKVTLDK